MTEPPEIALETMHATYNRLTQQVLPFKPYERLWADSVRLGVTSEHLVLVIEHIQAQNRNPKNDKKISLRLGKLLGEQERFWDYWGEADQKVRERAAKARQWKPTAGERARAAMCGHEPVPPQKEPVASREAIARAFGQISKELQ